MQQQTLEYARKVREGEKRIGGKSAGTGQPGEESGERKTWI
jgi:hypothetical protein